MGNAKSRNNSAKIEDTISTNLKSLSTSASAIYPKQDSIIVSRKANTTAAAITVGGPLLVEVKTKATKTTRKSNKADKDTQQSQEHYNHIERQQKAADSSVTSAVAEQQRLKQASSFWSLGSLNFNLSYSGRNSYKQRQKSSKRDYSTLQYQRKRSKTEWHKPVTNAIFSSHFKESSRNEEFHIDQLVAKGAFGVVFKVIDKKPIKDGQWQQQQQQQKVQPPVYALKVLKKSKIISENSLQQIKDEVDIQKLCGHHPFIVKQFDLWQNRHNLHILSEYIPNGELFSTIRTFSINLIRLYLAEIALALDFLHNAGVIYRDAKPENILLTHNYHIKLTDFGLSKWLKSGSTTKTICGTFQYMAPEILRGEPYTHAVDWWSLGIIVCQMFVKRSPDIRKFIIIKIPQDTVDDASHIKMNNNKDFLNVHHSNTDVLEVDNFLPHEVENLCHEAKDVLKRLLEFDARKRIRSIRTLQQIAMYKNFKIEAQYCLKIRPLDIITEDNISIVQNPEYIQNSVNAHKAFINF